MITNGFLLLVTGILDVIHQIFHAIPFTIPTAISDAFVKFFNYVHIGDGVFPVSQALLAIAFTLALWVSLYLVKVLLFAFSLIPWVGKVVHLPNHSSSITESEQFNASGKLMGRNISRRRWEK